MSLYFLMCSERSGSNFITQLLNGHSRICGPATKHIFNPVIRNLFRYEPLNQSAHWDQLLDDIERMINVPFSVWRQVFDKEELTKLASAGDIGGLLSGIFELEAKAAGKPDVFIKENQLYEILPFLLLRFPDARYVYQTRDPRDMALSWRANPDHPGGLIAGARRWKADQQRFMLAHNELKARNLSIFLRYEDLLDDPQYELERVLNVLGHAFEPSMLTFHQDELTQENANQQSAWKNLGQGVMKNNKAKYLKTLSQQEISYIESICRHEMALLGYRPETSAAELDAIEESLIAEYEREEQRAYPAVRGPGVKANMEAKRAFYERFLPGQRFS
ncbi:sulfotransferase family protein [Marinobacter mangrovi]|uniref:sulfotransferase family protein n=1 Tax=Marinobacter mangrovi TaxID=2803918 RepID=UPI001931FB2F|nr:sulfotransferase [Marinobacter mangrovi]